MKRLLLALLLFSSPVIAETNNLDKTFLDITMTTEHIGCLARQINQKESQMIASGINKRK